MESTLKIDDDDVFDLMDNASTIRHECSLLKIATSLTLRSHLDEASDDSNWVRQSKKLDGYFKHGGRGVHERMGTARG